MKSETTKLIIKMLIAILKGVASALGMASCMAAHGWHGLLV